MQHEIEAKFLDVMHDDIRAKLKALSAELEQPMRLMRRTLFDYPDKRLQHANHGRLRIRDEGDKLTITYKARGNSQYAEETETTIGSYDIMAELLSSIGLEAYSFQESKRETWHYQDVEVVLDEWPWLKPYIEIEGQTEASIMACAKTLGLDWSQAIFGSVDKAYMYYYPGITGDESIGDLAEVRFDQPLPQWLKDRQ